MKSKISKNNEIQQKTVLSWLTTIHQFFQKVISILLKSCKNYHNVYYSSHLLLYDQHLYLELICYIFVHIILLLSTSETLFFSLYSVFLKKYQLIR
jgi:ascorbate-specific PTS system EIIC-type component UlaA